MRELIMIRYYACIIYCTLKLSRSLNKRLFIRYGGWTVGSDNCVSQNESCISQNVGLVMHEPNDKIHKTTFI